MIPSRVEDENRPVADPVLGSRNTSYKVDTRTPRLEVGQQGKLNVAGFLRYA